jgi:hypothetical protein
MVLAGIIGTLLGMLVVAGSVIAVFHIALPRRVRALSSEITQLRERVALLEERLVDDTGLDTPATMENVAQGRDADGTGTAASHASAAEEAGTAASRASVAEEVGAAASRASVAEEVGAAASRASEAAAHHDSAPLDASEEPPKSAYRDQPGRKDRRTRRESSVDTETESRQRTTLATFLSRVEARFVAYWTGILGVIAIVVGFSFLAILTALRLNEFSRFVMVLAGGGVFWGLSEFLRRRGNEGLVIGWFWSAAGALVLFGCVGSLTIPWLRWVDSTPQAYAVLAVGIAVNAFLALNGVHQLFATFHVAISVAALAVAPPEFPTLVAATVVTLVGITPSLRRPWTFHIVASETAFFAFVVGWIVRFDPSTGGVTPATVDIGAAIAVITGLLPVIVTPYFKRTKPIYPGYTTARIAGWVYIVLAVVALGRSVQGVSAILALSGALAYLPMKIVREIPLGTKRTDLVAAVVLVVLAALGLERYNVDVALLAATAIGIILIAAIDSRGDYRFSAGLLIAAAVGTVVLAVGIAGDLRHPFPWVISPAVTTASMAVVAFLFLTVYRIVLEDTTLVRAAGGAGFFVALVGHIVAFGRVEVVPPVFSVPALPALVIALVLVVSDRSRERRTPSSSGSQIDLELFGWGALLVLVHLRAIVRIDALPSPSQSVRLGIAAALLLWSIAIVLRHAHANTRRGEIVRGLAWIVGTVDLVFVVGIAGEDLAPWIVVNVFVAVSLAFSTLSRAVQSAIAKRYDQQPDGTPHVSEKRNSFARLIPFSGIAIYLIAALATLALSSEGDLADHLFFRVITYTTVVGSAVVWTVRFRDGHPAPRMLPLVAVLVVVAGVGIVEFGESSPATVLLSTATLAVSVATVFPRYFSVLRPLSMIVFWLALVGLPFGGTFDPATRIVVYTVAWWRTIGTGLIGTLYLGITSAAGRGEKIHGVAQSSSGATSSPSAASPPSAAPRSAGAPSSRGSAPRSAGAASSHGSAPRSADAESPLSATSYSSGAASSPSAASPPSAAPRSSGAPSSHGSAPRSADAGSPSPGATPPPAYTARSLGIAFALDRRITDHNHRLLIIPFLLSVTVFFALTARGPVLTTLLVVESFALFTLGLLTGERSFRPTSYLFLLAALVRLIGYDMAQADTLERAIVFLVAGGVLIGMNQLHARFRERRVTSSDAEAGFDSTTRSGAGTNAPKNGGTPDGNDHGSS